MGLPIDRPSKVVCVGLNYHDHAAESGLPVPAVPMIFGKWSTSLIASGDPIVIPDGITQVDYEAELGVVIDREARDVSLGEALQFVRGYVCFNDVSARAAQELDGQWTRGKSFDSFGPVGPSLSLAASIPDPQDLGIRCRVNGVTVQESTTRNMIFSVAELIVAASRGTTLLPGDLIATGTPGGVGKGRTPQLWLTPGDVVEVEIDGLGVLTNPVTASDHAVNSSTARSSADVR